MSEIHLLMDGKLQLYQRKNSTKWQCYTFLEGSHWRKSTKEENLSLAKAFAENWYLDLLAKQRMGQLKRGVKFAKAAKLFTEEYEALMKDERNEKYIQCIKDAIRVHLDPFFGEMFVSDLDEDAMQRYRIHRMTSRINKRTNQPRRPSKTALHLETVVVRQVLKLCKRKKWIESIPDLSPPYKASGKITRRAWFSNEEYKKLYEATRERAKNPIKEQWRKECESLHNYVLFMGNTGLRPDECSLLEVRDVTIVFDHENQEEILDIEVRGKRGV